VGNCTRPRGLSESISLRLEGFRTDRREAGPRERQPRVLEIKLAQGAIRLKSTQIRWFTWWPGGRLARINGGQRRLKEELENNSRRPRDPTENRHSDSLKRVNLLFLWLRWRREMMLLMMAMMMRWQPVCYKAEWQRHCVLRNCSSGLSIWSSLHISECKNMRGEQTINMTNRAVPSGFHTSQLVLHAWNRVSDVHEFLYNYLLNVKDG
jgi:hypothetical protein